MATEHIGQTVHLTDEMADRIVEAMEEIKANPPKPAKREIAWGDSKKLAMSLKRQIRKCEMP
jgi:hypothetical protein